MAYFETQISFRRWAPPKIGPLKGPLKNISPGAYFRNFTVWDFFKNWRLRWKENNDKQLRENWKLTFREMFRTLVLTKDRLVSTVAKQSLCQAFTFHVFWGVCKKSIHELLNTQRMKILTGSTYTSSKLHSWCHWKQTQNTKPKQNYIVKVKRPLVLNARILKRKD